MHLSFALSITHFFSSVGADAGFAALVGLAILVLLYFAHARETSTLRDQLASAMRRIEELEHRLSGSGAQPIGAKQPLGPAAPSAVPAAAPLAASAPVAARPATANAPAPAPAPASTSAGAAGGPSSSVAPAVAPRPVSAQPVVAPAGVGAPPLSDATRVVPLAEPADDRASIAGDGAGATPGPGTGRTPSPVTAAAGGNGFSAGRAAGGVAEPPRSLLEHGLPGARRIPSWVIAALAVVLLAVIAGVLVLILLPGSSDQKATAVHHHHAPSIAAAPRGVTASLVTVGVVNATNINQLAHHVSALLTRKHFQPGPLGTATTQSGKTTTVGYLPGHRSDALAVAHALKLPASAVQPVTHNNEAVVCPSATSCPADVIVVAGPDLAPKR